MQDCFVDRTTTFHCQILKIMGVIFRFYDISEYYQSTECYQDGQVTSTAIHKVFKRKTFANLCVTFMQIVNVLDFVRMKMQNPSMIACIELYPIPITREIAGTFTLPYRDWLLASATCVATWHPWTMVNRLKALFPLYDSVQDEITALGFKLFHLA